MLNNFAICIIHKDLLNLVNFPKVISLQDSYLKSYISPAFFYQRAIDITKFIHIFLEQSMHPQLSIHIPSLPSITQMMSYYTHCVL